MQRHLESQVADQHRYDGDHHVSKAVPKFGHRKQHDLRVRPSGPAIGDTVRSGDD